MAAPKKFDEPMTRRNIFMPDEMWHRAQILAAVDRGRSVSDVLRDALEEYLENSPIQIEVSHVKR